LKKERTQFLTQIATNKLKKQCLFSNKTTYLTNFSPIVKRQLVRVKTYPVCSLTLNLLLCGFRFSAPDKQTSLTANSVFKNRFLHPLTHNRHRLQQLAAFKHTQLNICQHHTLSCLYKHTLLGDTNQLWP
jgi:hypothetical protein